MKRILQRTFIIFSVFIGSFSFGQNQNTTQANPMQNVGQKPTIKQSSSNAAKVAFSQKNYIEAINQAKMAINVNNKDISAYNILRLSYKATAQNGKYINTLKDYLSLNKINIDKNDITDAAYKAFSLKNYPLVVFFTQYYNNIDPSNSTNLNLMGVSLFYLKKYKPSISALQFAVKYNPDPSYYANLGRSYMALGDKNNALTSYRKALKINPSFKKAQIEIAKILNVATAPQVMRPKMVKNNNTGVINKPQVSETPVPAKTLAPVVSKSVQNQNSTEQGGNLPTQQSSNNKANMSNLGENQHQNNSTQASNNLN